MPSAQRDQVAAIGMDLAALARKEAARAPGLSAGSADRALQARKDLTAMGLRYYDQKQFLDAVKRDDALAVELYLLGRGVNVSGKGPDGRTALEIARENRNEQLESLLSRNLPATR
jgi:ankyrin repeat protein